MLTQRRRIRADIILILKITLVWMVLGILFTGYDYLVTSAGEFYTRTDNYSFVFHLVSNVGGAFIGGLMGASLIIFYTNRMLRQRSFLTYVTLNSLSVLAVIFLINLLISLMILTFRLNKPFYNYEVIEESINFMFSSVMLRNLLVWFMVTLGTTFILRVSEKYGPGVLMDTLLGKYHKPVVEERIFMFLDLKSSTSIAEELGHNRYFQFLRDFYADLTDPVIYNEGTVYQYVGDEVVVSWKRTRGLKDQNCLKCFFEAKEEIRKRSDEYRQKYGVVPTFKAGMHIGKATVGEIGVLKKEIAFTGDVLNTTSRIQGECNKYGADLLISGKLLGLLIDIGHYNITKIGDIELRGKKDKVVLYSITEKPQS